MYVSKKPINKLTLNKSANWHLVLYDYEPESLLKPLFIVNILNTKLWISHWISAWLYTEWGIINEFSGSTWDVGRIYYLFFGGGGGRRQLIKHSWLVSGARAATFLVNFRNTFHYRISVRIIVNFCNKVWKTAIYFIFWNLPCVNKMYA